MPFTPRAALAAMLGAVLVALPLAIPTPAPAQVTEQELVRARTTQLYLRAEDGIRDFFLAQTAFDRARSAGDRVGMTEAAAEMFAGSTAAAYWSVVLDERVKELGARAEVQELTSDLRDITTATYNRMSDIVSRNDMDELARRLDDSADALTRLREVVKRIYEVIQANVAGE